MESHASSVQVLAQKIFWRIAKIIFLCGVIQSVSRLGKICVVRIRPDTFAFVLNTSLRQVTHNYTVELLAEHFFHDYKMKGLNEQQNEIYLELPTEHLGQLARIGQSNASSLKISLVKRGDVPHLSFDVRCPSSGGELQNTTYAAPVGVLIPGLWPQYENPQRPAPNVTVFLPQLKMFQKVISGLRAMNTRYVALSANHSGQLDLVVDTDAVSVTSHFEDLADASAPVCMQPDVAPTDMFTVRVDIKMLHQFLSAQHLTAYRMQLGIAHHKAAVFTLEQDDLCVYGILPSVAK